MEREAGFHFVPNQLEFDREVDGSRETFVANYDVEKNSLRLKGFIKNPLELNEFVRFLRALNIIRFETGKEETDKEFDEYWLDERERRTCKCGSKDRRIIGRGIWSAVWGPLAGHGIAFNILQCESCGRLSKEITEMMQM